MSGISSNNPAARSRGADVKMPKVEEPVVHERTLGLWGLVFISYFWVSGGLYGLLWREESLISVIAEIFMLVLG